MTHSDLYLNGEDKKRCMHADTHTHTQLIGALLCHHCDLIGFSLCSSSGSKDDAGEEDDDGGEEDELSVFLPQSFSCVVFIFIPGRPPLSDTSGSERSGMFTETDELQHRHSLSSSSQSEAPPAAHCRETSLPSAFTHVIRLRVIGTEPTTAL